MPLHPCIFCPKSRTDPPQTPSATVSAGSERSGKVLRVALPVFMERVSPVLDTCTQLCLLEPERTPENARVRIPVKGTTVFERAAEFKKLEIGVIICGAVSESLFNLLRQAGIDLVCGITGDIEEVAEAYRTGSLQQGRFRMPGAD